MRPSSVQFIINDNYSPEIKKIFYIKEIVGLTFVSHIIDNGNSVEIHFDDGGIHVFYNIPHISEYYS